MDHGIENPEDRVKKGKPEEGTLHFKAYYSGAMVVIEIKDDGKGINPDMILSRKVGDNRADGELKANQLRRLFNLRQFKQANKVMFDDASSVRSTLRKLGIAVIHPRKYNERAVA